MPKIPKQFTLIVYHGNCTDGSLAAGIALMHSPNADVVGALYGQPPIALDRFRGKHVLFVDFSYSRDVMLQIQEVAASLLVLDHHKTAQAALSGLDFAIFDMDRSGCGLAWDTLFPEQARPFPVDAIEDVDTGRQVLDNSNSISAYFRAYKLDPRWWTEELTPLIHGQSVYEDAVIASGETLLEVQEISHKAQLENFTVGTLPEGKVAIINHTYEGISSLLYTAISALEVDIAIGWFMRGDGKFQLSFRSGPNGPDVSLLAQQFGGGGHVHAAGAELDSFIDIEHLYNELIREKE